MPGVGHWRAESSQSASPFLALGFLVPFLVFGAIFLGGICFVIYGIVGAVMTIQGKPFRYVIIGNRVEHFMQPRQSQDMVANQ